MPPIQIFATVCTINVFNSKYFLCGFISIWQGLRCCGELSAICQQNSDAWPLDSHFQEESVTQPFGWKIDLLKKHHSKLPFLWQVIGITSHREGSRYPIGWMFGKVPKVGAQRFTRGVDEEIDIFWVSGQNFSFNLSKHITLNFILYQCQYHTMTLNI